MPALLPLAVLGVLALTAALGALLWVAAVGALGILAGAQRVTARRAALVAAGLALAAVAYVALAVAVGGPLGAGSAS